MDDRDEAKASSILPRAIHVLMPDMRIGRQAAASSLWRHSISASSDGQTLTKKLLVILTILTCISYLMVCVYMYHVIRRIEHSRNTLTVSHSSLFPTCFTSSLEPSLGIPHPNHSSPSQRPSFEQTGLTCYALLSPSITFSLFHSELKTYLFGKSYPPP